MNSIPFPGFTRWLILFAIVLLPDWVAAQVAERKPNIILILADDLGKHDLGNTGSTFYETPNIDELAKQGTKFSQFTVNQNCAPTRASLMSGQYSTRTGIYTVGSGNRGKTENRMLNAAPNEHDLSPSIYALPKALRDAGYRTALIGKWHLGTNGSSPESHGFQVNIAGSSKGHPPSYFSPYKLPNLTDGPAGEYLTDRLTDEAVKFIETNKSRPFFLYLSHYAPHTPLQAKPELVAKYKAKPVTGAHSNAVYAAMIESMDQSVGRVVKKLGSLGLSKSTLVIFMSDNGGVERITSNAPLRSVKGSLYEGGIRVPFIAKFPGVIPIGKVNTQPANAVDIYPTLLEVAGIGAPSGQIQDGISIWSEMNRTAPADFTRGPIFWHLPGYLESKGTPGVLWRTTPCGAIREGDYKLIEYFEDGRLELYNLKQDLGETKNLASSKPAVAKKLHDKLVAWRKATNAKMPTPNPDYVPPAQ
jgi:arylsulfatase A-like enzyme